MAVVDANYKFISIDVGGNGSEGDSHLFGRTEIGRMIVNDDPNLYLPPDAPVGFVNLPFFLLPTTHFH